MLTRETSRSWNWHRVFALSSISLIGLGAILGTALLLGTPPTTLAETFTASNIVATSTLTSNGRTTSAEYVLSTGTSPQIITCNASPPTSLQPAGSLCIDTTNSLLYQTSGGGVWTQVGGASTGFSQVLSVPGTTLTGWNQNAGTWTANPLTVDDGTSESYLRYTSGGTTVPPQPQATYIVQADIAFATNSTTSTDAGLCIACQTAGPGSTSGNIRAFVRRDGSVIGVDVAGAALLVATNPGLGDLGVGNFHTFRVVKTGRDFDVYFDGTLYLSASVSGGGSINDSAWGLWTNPGHAEFRNVKEWALTTP